MRTETRTPSVAELQKRHQTAVRGAGCSALDQMGELIGVANVAPGTLVPLGKGRLIVLLPDSVGSGRKQKVTSVTLLALGLVRDAAGLRYMIQQDYDLWKTPAVGSTEPGKMDPRWPIFDRRNGVKPKGRGDVLLQGINLFADMADVARQIAADTQNMFALPVVPELPTVLVTSSDEPATPAEFSAGWVALHSQTDCEKMFASNVIPPDDVENTTGFWLAPVGAYAELPTHGQFYELHHLVQNSQTLYRASAFHELLFDRKLNFSQIELDLTQRRFSRMPKASGINLGGATLEVETAPSAVSQISALAEV